MLLGLWRGNGDNPSLGCTLWTGRPDTWVSALSGLWLQASDLALPPCLYPWASGAPSTTWLFCPLCISTICAASNSSAVRCARAAATDCQLQPHKGGSFMLQELQTA